MTILQRYIALTVLSATAIVLVVMAAIYIIFTFIAQAGDIGHGSYGIGSAILYVLFNMPANIYLALPMAALLGSLMGLGILANHSELIVMRAAGVSVVQIAKGVLIAGVILMIIAFAVGSYIGPVLQHQAAIRKALNTQGQAFLMTAQSAWLKQGNNFTYIDKVHPDGRLTGVRRYHIENGQLQMESTAKTAVFKNKAWHMQDVTTLTFSNNQVKKSTLKNQVWPSLVRPALLQLILTKSNNLTLDSLIHYIHYRQHNGLTTARYRLSLWQLIFQPFSIAILMLLAVPFVFGPLRSSSFGLRFAIGIVMGIVFFIINQFFGPFTLVYDLPPFLGALTPTVFFLLVLLLMLWRLN